MEYTKICQWCGKLFTTNQVTGYYCSNKCGTQASHFRHFQSIREAEEFEQMKDPLSLLHHLDYLSIQQAALIMGVSRQYIYTLVYKGKLKATRISKRKSFIKRTDIDVLMNSNPYTRIAIPPKEEKTVILSDYYTTEDIMEKYHLNKQNIWTACRRYGIRRVAIKGRNYYHRRDIDESFRKYENPVEDDQWISAETFEHDYHMTSSQRYSFTHTHKIPTKKKDKKNLYSRVHIENVLHPDSENYYTTNELMDLLGVKQVSVHTKCTYHHIRSKKVGKMRVWLKVDVDKYLLKKPQAPESTESTDKPTDD